MSKSLRRERNDDRTSGDKPLSGSSPTADEKLDQMVRLTEWRVAVEHQQGVQTARCH